MMERGKKSKHPVRQYFTFDENEKKNLCKIEGCADKYSTIKGDHAGNLMKHLERHHPTEANKVKEFLKSVSCQQSSEMVPVYFSRQNIIDALVEVITVNARPYKTLTDSGMRLILDPIENAFKERNLPLALNIPNIKEAGDAKFEEMKNEVRQLFHMRPFSIQIDLCKCNDRNILAIVAQFIKNGKLVLRTLGMKRLYCRATGINIVNKILKTFDEFALDLQKLVAVTSDNGSNVVLCAKILKAYQKNSLDDLMENEIDSSEMDTFLQIVQRCTQQIENNCQELMEHIKCSSHLVDLAFNDTIKECDNERTILNDCRELVKYLRTPNVVNQMIQSHEKKAIIDVPTRWLSEFKMLVRLLELKQFCDGLCGKDFDACKLNENVWMRVAKIVDVNNCILSNTRPNIDMSRT